MKTKIIKLLVLIIAPLLISAGYSGSGSGCAGCGGGGGGDETTVNGAAQVAGDDTTVSDNPLVATGVSKDILGMMPAMDAVFIVKLDQLSGNPLVKGLFDKLQSTDSESVAKGGSVGKGLLFAAKEALPPDIKNVLVVAFKFDWPVAIDSDKGPQLKELMAFIFEDQGNYFNLKAKLQEQIQKSLTGATKTIGDVEFQELKGPTFCNKEEDPNCKETPMYLGTMPDKQTFVISSLGAAEEFTANFMAAKAVESVNALPDAAKSVAKATAGNPDIKQYLNSVICSAACGALSTPFADLVQDAVAKNNEKFMAGFGAMWKDPSLFNVTAAAIGLDVGERYGIEVAALSKDAKKIADFSISFDKTLFENLNFDKLFSQASQVVDNSCHESVTTNCSQYTTKDECEKYYYNWSKDGGGSEPHNCMWSDEGFLDNQNIRRYCYTNGSNATENVCEPKEGSVSGAADTSSCAGDWNMNVSSTDGNTELVVVAGSSQNFYINLTGNGAYMNIPASLRLVLESVPPVTGGFGFELNDTSPNIPTTEALTATFTVDSNTPAGSYRIRFAGSATSANCGTMDRTSGAFTINVIEGGSVKQEALY